MKASEIFNLEECNQVKQWLGMCNGIVTKVTDEKVKVLFESDLSFENIPRGLIKKYNQKYT